MAKLIINVYLALGSEIMKFRLMSSKKSQDISEWFF